MSVDEVITTNIPTKGNDMNIKTEFEQFLAVKAEEFVSKKANMTIAEFRELNSVLDSCGIDFSNLPTTIVPVVLPTFKKLVRSKSIITTKQINDFILSSLSNGNMATRKELYDAVDIHFADSLTYHDTSKNMTGMSKIKTRIYTQTRELLASGKIAEFKSNNGKVYFHRARPIIKPETQLKVII